jgi:glycosyltransferase involved in cell wall biosynthesis
LFEGLPLVVVEALACGCRLVATALPGIVAELEPHLEGAITLVEPPALATVDEPEPSAAPAFVRRLEEALDEALDGPRPPPPPARFTWPAVFERVEAVWLEALKSGP